MSSNDSGQYEQDFNLNQTARWLHRLLLAMEFVVRSASSLNETGTERKLEGRRTSLILAKPQALSNRAHSKAIAHQFPTDHEAGCSVLCD